MRILLHVYLTLAGIGLLYVGFSAADPISVTVASLALCLTAISYFGQKPKMDAETVNWIVADDFNTPHVPHTLTENQEPQEPSDSGKISEIQPLKPQDLVEDLVSPPARQDISNISFVEMDADENYISQINALDQMMAGFANLDRKRLVLTRMPNNSQKRFQGMSIGRYTLDSVLFKDIYKNIDMINCMDEIDILSKNIVDDFIKTQQTNYDEIICFFPKEEESFWKQFPLQDSDYDIKYENSPERLS